ncbi:MAG TPA: transketolase C-terminal domain-containing protein, partial [Patescibacteria group bacterium]
MTNPASEASIRQAFGDTIVELARSNSNLYVVDIDLKPALYLDKFAARYKSRFIECGVAESNAAGVASGLASAGKTVFLCSFSCFSPAINWAVIKQSVCYQNLPVVIVGSHSGLLSGDLGATHQMLEDVALMRTLPGMEVFAPADAYETQKITTVLSRSSRPSYLRLVRPATSLVTDTKSSFTIGKSNLISRGSDATIISYGPVLAEVLEALKISKKQDNKITIDVINCSSIKPLDTAAIIASVSKTKHLLVVEDHQKQGGLGEAVSSLILSAGIRCRFSHLAVD